MKKKTKEDFQLLLSKQVPIPSNLEPLHERPHSRINRIPLLLHLPTRPPHILERHIEAFDKLVRLQLRFGIVVAWVGEINFDVDEVQIGVEEP